MIAQSTFLNASVELVSYKKGEIIFFEQRQASYYFQINRGQVKMISFTLNGKEVIQKIFEEGESFGEPPLLGDFPYPARAQAISNCEIWRMPKKNFIQLLKNEPSLHFKMTKLICKRLEYKANLLQRVFITSAKERILSFIKFLDERQLGTSLSKQYYVYPYTRQQLADSLALRVETVIRAVKELEEEGEIKIIKRKICRSVNLPMIV